VSHWRCQHASVLAYYVSTHDLELDTLAIELDRPDLAGTGQHSSLQFGESYAQVNADSGNERGGPRVVAEAQKQTRLADALDVSSRVHVRVRVLRE
jgi:hypothetical protein